MGGWVKLVPIQPAMYPKLYMEARAALFRSDQIDECQEWANKAAAMASYAAQARDTSLRDMANRIHARAVRRCGELLTSIPSGTRCTPTRKAAADSAGLTRLQRNQASAVANIPARKFEALVEGNKPPRVYQLAQIGTKPRGRPIGGAIGSLHRQLEKAQSKAAKYTAKLTTALEKVREIQAKIAVYQVAA
jgi:hypothetical protein